MQTSRVALVAGLVLGVGACSPEGAGGGAETASQAAGTEGVSDLGAMLEPYGIPGDDVRAAIEGLDQVPQERPLSVTGSVRMGEVVLSDGSTEITVPVPGDEVYVSVAPYLTTTHDCFYHALGGCQGELVEEDVQVQITGSDGTVLVDEATTTYANGFVGYWLPKETTGTITVTQGGRTGAAEFDTGADGATCITTLRLT